jgi:hypothetical protein
MFCCEDDERWWRGDEVTTAVMSCDELCEVDVTRCEEQIMHNFRRK